VVKPSANPKSTTLEVSLAHRRSTRKNFCYLASL
jgi:hypothetical protein